MPRSYFNIQQYEKEILEMKKQGLFCSEIAKRLGLTKSQIRGFLARYEKNQRRKIAGFIPNKKGKPSIPDPYENLKMEIYKREVTIKRLTMENELIPVERHGCSTAAID